MPGEAPFAEFAAVEVGEVLAERVEAVGGLSCGDFEVLDFCGRILACAGQGFPRLLMGGERVFEL